MRDPKPMFEGGATELERRWLSEARAEEPPPELVRRIERALGIGPGPAATPAAPRVQAAASAGKGVIVASLAALGVGGAVGLVLLLTRGSPPPAHDPPAAPENVAAVTTAPPADGLSHGVPGQIAPAAATATAALRDEISLIDGARTALAAGSPAQALSLLDRYRARHPRGVLLPEALAMRIDAIDRSGDHERARALARSFVAEHPHSPLAQRLAQIAKPPAATGQTSSGR